MKCFVCWWTHGKSHINSFTSVHKFALFHNDTSTRTQSYNVIHARTHTDTNIHQHLGRLFQAFWGKVSRLLLRVMFLFLCRANVNPSTKQSPTCAGIQMVFVSEHDSEFAKISFFCFEHTKDPHVMDSARTKKIEHAINFVMGLEPREARTVSHV